MAVTFLPAKKSLSNLDCSSGWERQVWRRLHHKRSGLGTCKFHWRNILHVFRWEWKKKGKICWVFLHSIKHNIRSPRSYVAHAVPQQLQNYWTPNAAHFACLPNQAHLIQIITSLVKTPRCEMGLSDKADIQHVQMGDGWLSSFSR